MKIRLLARIVCAFLLIAPCLSPDVFADQNTVETDIENGTLRLTGWLDPAGVFVRTVRVTAHAAGEQAAGGNPASAKVAVAFQATDLAHENGVDLVTRDQVTVAGDVSVEPGKQSVFVVRVTGVKLAGTYTGKLQVSAGGGAPIELALIVNAVVRPNVTLPAGFERQHLFLVNAGTGGLNPSGWLAKALVPATALADAYDLRLLRPSRSVFTIEKASVLLRADATATSLGSDAVTVAPVQTSGPALTSGSSVVDLKVTPNRSAIPAGHYSGSVLLDLTGRDEPVAIPFEISVKHGPLMPILVLLFSVVVGRLYRYMQETGAAAAAALDSIGTLRGRIERAGEETCDILEPQLDRARALIYAGEAAAGSDETVKIEKRLVVLEYLLTAVELLAPFASNPRHREALALVAAIRASVSLRDDTTAATNVTELGSLVKTIVETPSAGGPSPLTGMASAAGVSAKFFRKTLEMAGQRFTPADGATETGGGTIARVRAARDWAWQAMGFGNALKAEATALIVRPLIWLVLLVGLVALGFDTLYAKNAVFGANAISDYVALFFWGVSADVASRTLGNLGERPLRPPV